MDEPSRHRDALSRLINENHLLTDFKTFVSSPNVSNYNGPLLPRFPDQARLDSRFNDLIREFNSLSSPVPKDLPPLLTTFFGVIRPLFPPHSVVQLLNTWPLSLPQSTNLQNIIIFLLHLIRGSRNPHLVLQVISEQVMIREKHDQTIYTLKAFCRCHFRSDPPPAPGENRPMYWATLNSDNLFELFKIESDRLLLWISFELGEARPSASGHSMRIFSIDGILFGDLQPLDPADVAAFAASSKSDQTIKVPPTVFFEGNVHPESFYYSFYQQLICDDLILLQTITDVTVCRVSDFPDLGEVLFNVFAYAGRINLLFTALTAIEFSDPALEMSGILLRNSHLTGLFEAVGSRFGAEYYRCVVAKLKEYVMRAGDLQIRSATNCNPHHVQKVVVTVLKAIMQSGSFIPEQLRHVGSVLRAMVGYRFNRVQAVVNALSGFFCLRFLTPMIMENNTQWEPSEERKSSHSIDPAASGEIGSARSSSAAPKRLSGSDQFLSFAQVLQVPLNITLYHGNYAQFAQAHHHLIRHIFPQLIPFTLSIADFDKEPDYPPPSKEDVQKAIGFLVSAICKSREKFSRRFAELHKTSSERSPASYAFGAFLMSFFTACPRA
jgi:hypothetical protein